MFFVHDIGNSNVDIGIYDGEKLVFMTKLATDKKRTAEQYALEVDSLLKIKGIDINKIEGSIISSVVPELTFVIKKAVSILTGINSIVLGPGVKSGINIKIDNPAELGADLVAGAVGAISKYPVPCLVMDLGTATKISVIDENGNYRGVMITSGVAVSMKALAGSASLLSSVDITSSNIPAYGTNTTASLQSGFITGTAAMLDGMVDRIEESLGTSIKSLVATGGLSGLVIGHCKKEIVHEPTLLLDGLRIIYNRNKK